MLFAVWVKTTLITTPKSFGERAYPGRFICYSKLPISAYNRVPNTLAVAAIQLFSLYLPRRQPARKEP